MFERRPRSGVTGNVNITIRLSEEWMREIAERADEKGQSKPDWIRDVLGEKLFGKITVAEEFVIKEQCRQRRLLGAILEAQTGPEHTGKVWHDIEESLEDDLNKVQESIKE